MGLELHLAPLPASSTAVVVLNFAGPEADRFRANVNLNVSADRNGAVAITLGNVSLSCV